MARRGKSWTMSEIERTIEMRDKQHMKWIDIARTLGRCGPGKDGPAAVCAAYSYWKAKFAHDAALRAQGMEPPKRRKRFSAEYGAPIAASPSVAAQLDAPIKRPRYVSDADQFVMGRIASQGLTAGFLGDPPRGRSALDQKRQ